MITIKAAPSTANNVGEATLKQAPARLLTFLEGARQAAIGSLLKKRGFSQAQFKEGWTLLKALESVSEPPPSMDDPSVQAIAACEAFQNEEMACARAILERSHPDHAATLFRDLAPTKGVAAALAVSTFLERVYDRKAREPSKAERKADDEVMAILSQTGMTPSRRKEVANAVAEIASSAGDARARETSTELEDKRLEALRSIHAWVSMWSGVARTIITRRDQLITLGLAKRRSLKRDAPAAPEPEDAPPPATEDAAPPSRAA